MVRPVKSGADSVVSGKDNRDGLEKRISCDR
jgi:hypothetical protein